MPTLKDWLPALGILLTALLGLGTYAWQEKVKRETALAERKQKLYEELIRNMIELLVVRTPPERSQLISEIEKEWLFASDSVLRASYAYLNLYNRVCCPVGRGTPITFEELLNAIRSDANDKQEFGQSLAAIFAAMRLDIRPGTEISLDWAKENFRIYLWGIIAKYDELAPAAEVASRAASSR